MKDSTHNGGILFIIRIVQFVQEEIFGVFNIDLAEVSWVPAVGQGLRLFLVRICNGENWKCIPQGVAGFLA
jgi:hypothetical protein